MRILLITCLFASSALWAQNSKNSQSNSQSPASPSASSAQTPASGNPKLEAPRSDSVNVRDLGAEEGESSSKDTQIDLSPPPDDEKEHPRSAEILMDERSPGSDAEMHPWDPHRAAKDIEVGDYYFKKKNYAAAESRYREALYYKDNDALATYHLAICLEKLDRPQEARGQYESYLKILPNGPQAEDAKKSVERLNRASSSSTKAAK